MPRTPKPLAAIAYDFDGTLAPGNMQDRNFIPELGLKPKAFWAQVKAHAERHNGDEILSYMNLMLRHANENDVRINRSAFETFGAQLPLFPGVEEWFRHINAYVKRTGLRIEHYIISSGLREMIAGTRIARAFKCVFASGFEYDQHDVARWPALAINYTNKTQYLFRINKGILNAFDNTQINAFTEPEKRRIPFERMIYIGDGDTDVPSMKMIKYQGGYPIAVFQARKKGAKTRALRLVEQKRADYVFPANYTVGSPLCKAVEDIIVKISAECRLSRAGKPKPADGN